ncbi:MAG: hypothetical protein AAFY02_10530 [Pseudomonadota bacterium]
MMTRRHTFRSLVAGVGALGLLAGALVTTAQAQEEQDYLLATASTGGTFTRVASATPTG